MRRAMRRRAALPEIKYHERAVNFVVGSGAAGYWELTPETMPKGTSSVNSMVGTRLKSRYLKVEFEVKVREGVAAADHNLFSFPVRVAIVSRRISEDVAWQAYLDSITLDDVFFKGEYAQVFLDTRFYLGNPYNDAAIERNRRHFKKVIKYPRNFTYTVANPGQITDKKDMVYLCIYNEALAGHHMDLTVNGKQRMSFIDN